MILFALGYWIGTEYITPDLDTNSKAYRRWGILRIIWLPYKLCHKHRGVSHSIGLGAAGRIVYFAVVVFGLYWIVCGYQPDVTRVLESIDMLVFLAGIAAANAGHILLDRLF